MLDNFVSGAKFLTSSCMDYMEKDEGGKDANYIIYLGKARHVLFFAYPKP